MQYAIKLALTAVLIVAIAEIGKRSTLIAAALASIPLISVMAIVWLYIDTKEISRVNELSIGIFWLVLPSLPFFWVLPALLNRGINFYLSLTAALGVTIMIYAVMLYVMTRVQA